MLSAAGADNQHGLGGAEVDLFFNQWVFAGLILGAALACLLRGITTTSERAAWLLMGCGILLWVGGSITYDVLAATLETVPIPSAADAAWLPAYPAMYAAFVLLVRARMPGCDRSLWLDGAIGALAIAAVAATLVLGPIMQATTGSFGVVATGLAYVGVDLVLLILVITVFGLSEWRPGRAWILLGAGLLMLQRRLRRLAPGRLSAQGTAGRVPSVPSGFGRTGVWPLRFTRG